MVAHAVQQRLRIVERATRDHAVGQVERGDRAGRVVDQDVARVQQQLARPGRLAGAQQARQLASGSRDIAEKGGGVVGNNAGNLLELDAILAVTLGGTLLTGGRFSLAGSMIGALIIQTLTSTIYSIGVPPEINLVVKAAVVFVVMLMQSAEFRRAVRGWVVRPATGSHA